MNLRFTDRQSVAALVLIGLGLVLLLDTLDIVPIVADLVVSLLFLAGSALFLGYFLQDQRQWWALFPAFGLASLGVTTGLDELLPWLNLGGTVFLGGIGLSFLTIYAVRREHWWPIIPGGALMTLAVITFVDNWFPSLDSGWLFFFGLALTFAAVYLVGESQHQQATWALIVAAACAAVGLLTIGGFLLRMAFPLFLVAVGLFLLFRTDLTRKP